MPAATHNIVIEQGSTYSMTLTYPGDLTGYVARSQIRSDRGAGEILANFEVSVIPAAGASQIIMSLAADDSSAIARTSSICAYDLEIESVVGVIRLIKGLVCLDWEVTR